MVINFRLVNWIALSIFSIPDKEKDEMPEPMISEIGRAHV